MDMCLTTNFFINRLRDMIYEYELRNREKPKFILTTTKAYWFLENYAREFTLFNGRGTIIAYFNGIEIRMVSGDGCEVFLCGEPLTIRE